MLHFLDQVYEHFGISFALKCMAVLQQGTFQERVVFDDAVVDQHKATVAAAVWVCVDVVGFAVGGPAGMAHAGSAGHVFIAGECFQFRHLAFFLVHIQRAVLDGDSGAVVSSVFETVQAFNNDRVGLLGTDIGDDTTHGMTVLSVEF